MKSSFLKRLRKQIEDNNVRGAREAVLEDLFNDFHRNRWTIYRFNFFRGIFFGFGSVLGGTVLIAGCIWLLNATGHLVPGVADFLNQISGVMQQTVKK